MISKLARIILEMRLCDGYRAEDFAENEIFKADIVLEHLEV